MAAVLERNQARRTRQIALHYAHLRLFLGIPLVTEIDPEQLGLIDASSAQRSEWRANSA